MTKRRKQQTVALLVALAASSFVPADTGAGFRLDVENGVGGILFGAPPPAGLQRITGIIGKRWRATQLYTRPLDTTRLHGLGQPETYWFRQGQFEGVTLKLASESEIPHLLTQLTALYGAGHPDTVATDYYWLGQHSYVLLERDYPHGAWLELGSLTMLNEKRYEFAVRTRARRQLGWRPDAAGLFQQIPVEKILRYAQRQEKKAAH